MGPGKGKRLILGVAVAAFSLVSAFAIIRFYDTKEDGDTALIRQEVPEAYSKKVISDGMSFMEYFELIRKNEGESRSEISVKDDKKIVTEEPAEITVEESTVVSTQAIAEVTTKTYAEAATKATIEAATKATTEAATTETASKVTTELATKATTEATTKVTTEAATTKVTTEVATTKVTTEATTNATTEVATKVTTEATTEAKSQAENQTTTEKKEHEHTYIWTREYIGGSTKKETETRRRCAVCRVDREEHNDSECEGGHWVYYDKPTGRTIVTKRYLNYQSCSCGKKDMAGSYETEEVEIKG